MEIQIFATNEEIDTMLAAVQPWGRLGSELGAYTIVFGHKVLAESESNAVCILIWFCQEVA